MNAGKSNVQRSGRSKRGISNAVMNEKAQLSPVVSTGPPQRPTHTTGHARDSIAAQIGLSVVRRSGSRRVADTSQLQALLEYLTNRSATISKGNENSKEDIATANV